MAAGVMLRQERCFDQDVMTDLSGNFVVVGDRDVDAERAHYLKLRFGMESTNPHLDDLLILVRRR